eukprot:4533-Heterococcus_DN1.PRE.2
MSVTSSPSTHRGPFKHLPPVESSLNLDVELRLPLEDLDGTDEIDFNGIDEDLKRFQKDDIVRQALSQGVDLRGYSRDIETELREVEMDSVREYVSQSDKVLELHNEIQGCDAILARMQEMLLGFQADLGGISDEIRHLQDESISLNIKLKNRRSAEERLGKFLSNVLVPPELAAAICSDELNDAYIGHVAALNGKIKYVLQNGEVGHLLSAATESVETDSAGGANDGSSLDVAPADTATAREVRPHLEKLRAKACARSREYLLARISELRRPKTNVQIIQKNALLKYKYLVQFITDNAPETAEEVRSVYIESMGRTISNLFRAYHAQLAKLEMEDTALSSTYRRMFIGAQVANKNDLIAVEEAAVRNMFNNKVDLTKRGDAFGLGDRDKQLQRMHLVMSSQALECINDCNGCCCMHIVVIGDAEETYTYTRPFLRQHYVTPAIVCVHVNYRHWKELVQCSSSMYTSKYRHANFVSARSVLHSASTICEQLCAARRCAGVLRSVVRLSVL